MEISATLSLPSALRISPSLSFASCNLVFFNNGRTNLLKKIKSSIVLSRSKSRSFSAKCDAALVFGPKKLPEVGRSIGKTVKNFQQSLSVNNGGRKLVIAEAKKKKKVDSHSFVAKPDEATGPFPEAVLLKEEKVQEDGRLLPEFADAEEEMLYEFLNLQLESDLNVERVRHYEVVYLIHEDRVEEVPTVISKVEEFIREKKGRIWRVNNWGLRRLAYKIKKAKKANYILTNFEMEAKWINDFKSMLDKDERVIRHLVIKRDKAITEDCPPPLEFHTLREGMDGDEDRDFDDEEEEEEEDWDDEGEIDMEDDIILVDEEEEIDDYGEERDNRSVGASREIQRSLNTGKLAR